MPTYSVRMQFEIQASNATEVINKYQGMDAKEIDKLLTEFSLYEVSKD